MYTRWGRTTCSGDSSIVYTGYAASGHGGQTCSGRNYLCVIKQPEWGNIKPGQQPYTSLLYGAVYAFVAADIYSNQPFSWANFNNQDPSTILVACAVCESPNAQVIMVPGAKSCPSDLYAEYDGYLVAGWYGSTAGNDWVCLDNAPEPAGAKTGAYHANMHAAEFFCGSLPCATFPTGNEVSCVVCSK